MEIFLSLKSEKILKMRNNGKDYLNFALCSEKLEKPKNYYQHRFVWFSKDQYHLVLK